jgi:3'-phosphoadenosine 5'-phosphosulfate (PAPS) 3'-phosphatase
MDEIAPSRVVGLGGCGNKCKALIENVCDAYIRPISTTHGLSYWDICACEPLVRARGGTLFLGNMDKVTYYDGNDYINSLIAFRTVKVQELMKRRKDIFNGVIE